MGLIYSSGPVAKTVVLILLFFSIVSWAIILFKWGQLRAAEKDGASFLDHAKNADSFKRLTTTYADSPESPFYRLLVTSYREYSARQKENQSQPDIVSSVESIAKITISEETERLEKRLSFLATTANTAPFIGLFGTVWGIMDSFKEIGLKGTTSLAVVAPGISEALITTALGLATAIPAVLGYNYLINRLGSVSKKMEHASLLIAKLINR
jgi:biopolymer transport protein TolQ